MRGARICRVDENGHLNSANFRLQKRSAQFFIKRFSSQTESKDKKIIDCEPFVSVCDYDLSVA